MSRYTIEGETLTGIADAVRSITGGETLLTPAQIESEIEGTAATMQDDISELKTIITTKPDVKDSDATGVDLDVSDPSGNVLLRLAGGHIQTKEFDSSDVASDISDLQNDVEGITSDIEDIRTDIGDLAELDTTDKSNLVAAINEAAQSGGGGNGNIDVKDSISAGIDLDISDESGNVIVRFANGYVQTANFDSADFADINTYVTVKKDGSGDFTTLRGAIESITDADPDTNPYVIQIFPGTYNLTDEYTQSEIAEADVSNYHNGFVGWMLTDGISLHGIGSRDAIILSCVLDTITYNATIRGNVSTLNTQGTANIENITVIAENCRYCVHDDFHYTKPTQYTRHVNNCKFIGKNLSHNPACTWGGGMSGVGEHAIFENCDFGTDYGHHFDASKSAHITFKHCRGRKLRLAERGGSNHHYVTIEDSDFDMISLMRPSNISFQRIFVEATGCENAYVSCYDGDIVLTGAITKTPLTNLAVGTMVAKGTAAGNQYAATSDKGLADGVVIANDAYYTYIQRTGYINTRILGLSGFNIGDYITIDGSNKLATGGTASNAVGQITFISDDSDATDDGIGFIKLFIGGM